MCVTIEIEGEYNSTVGDLQNSNHIGEIFYINGWSGCDVSVNECLCCVDVERTLRASGYRWKRDGGMDYVAVKHPTASDQETE